MARITFNGVTIDPLRQSHELASASLVSEDASASDHLLVRTTRIPSVQEKEQLAELGVLVHEYVPESTYLCGYRPADLGAVRASPFVAWADVHLEGFEIAPSIRPGGLHSDLADDVQLTRNRMRLTLSGDHLGALRCTGAPHTLRSAIPGWRQPCVCSDC
ncbi:hypothetical protein [Streptomyces sp. R33]|uniref:Uncharacterized protein n=1 Tax=Streptomyces sp. R33 TaxID=3238629 RepID=A0AB39XYM1_9ACTN